MGYLTRCLNITISHINLTVISNLTKLFPNIATDFEYENGRVVHFPQLFHLQL